MKNFPAKGAIGFVLIATMGACSSFIWNEGLYNHMPTDWKKPVSFTFFNTEDSCVEFVSQRMMYYSDDDDVYLTTSNDPGLLGIDSATYVFKDQKFAPVNFFKKSHITTKTSDRLKGSIDLNYLNGTRLAERKVLRVSFTGDDEMMEQYCLVIRPVGDTIIYYKEKKLSCLKVETSVKIRYYQKSYPDQVEVYTGPLVITYAARSVGPVMYTVSMDGKTQRWLLRDIVSPDNIVVNMY